MTWLAGIAGRLPTGEPGVCCTTVVIGRGPPDGPGRGAAVAAEGRTAPDGTGWVRAIAGRVGTASGRCAGPTPGARPFPLGERALIVRPTVNCSVMSSRPGTLAKIPLQERNIFG
jgi:hypothetical protein